MATTSGTRLVKYMPQVVSGISEVEAQNTTKFYTDGVVVVKNAANLLSHPEIDYQTRLPRHASFARDFLLTAESAYITLSSDFQLPRSVITIHGVDLLEKVEGVERAKIVSRGTYFEVTVIIAEKDRDLEDKIYDQYLMLLDQFQDYEFDLSLIYRNGRNLDALIGQCVTY